MIERTREPQGEKQRNGEAEKQTSSQSPSFCICVSVSSLSPLLHVFFNLFVLILVSLCQFCHHSVFCNLSLCLSVSVLLCLKFGTITVCFCNLSFCVSICVSLSQFCLYHCLFSVISLSVSLSVFLSQICHYHCLFL